ncbi:hypothetical protein F5050DRAFT_1807284 [Lentinula boryana]|uniref:Arrestin-like N-terminal domain-containing protein n=1 Tax=Lentinula boryana TaxID=40481 RepID=A0ABQ8QEC8_9AGAR|nr:hypothetical protein F5050DRAFT_1807284 [Lentinula boryana]
MPSTTQSVASSLPNYSVSAPPPDYSAQVTEGEELLAATHTSFSSRRADSYSRSWDRGPGIRVVLRELNEDIVDDIPVYHQRGLICGTIYQDNVRNTLQIEGKLKFSVFGNNSHTRTVKVVDECYELWSRSPPQVGPSADSHGIEFSSVLPTTFRDGDRSVPIPPSHEISLMGVPGVYSQCTYALKILVVTRGPLWNKTQSFTIPFKYRSRSRPLVPLVTNEGIQPGCPIFHATIKSAPEVWFETLSILQTKTASGLKPVEVQIFIPSGRTFGLADTIPFHTQLTGTSPSIQKLYTLLSPLSASAEYRALQLSQTLSAQSTADSISSIDRGKYSVVGRSDRDYICFSVTLTRQVCVELKDQVVWKSFNIGKGVLHPIPPPFELAMADNPFFSDSAEDDSKRIVNLDSAGEIQCWPDIHVGHFNVGDNVQVKDFLVVQIAPSEKSDNARSPFLPLKMAIPIFLVTDSWSEQPMFP